MNLKYNGHIIYLFDQCLSTVGIVILLFFRLSMHEPIGCDRDSVREKGHTESPITTTATRPKKKERGRKSDVGLADAALLTI